MQDQGRAVFRPRSARWLAVAVWAICALNLVTFAVLGQWTALVRAVPIVLLVSFLAWMVFAAPSVVIAAEGVTLVNPTRTIHVPWGAIKEVQPGYSLVIRTDDRRYHAWGAPGGTQIGSLGNFKANEKIVMRSTLPDDGRLAVSALVDPTQSSGSASLGATYAIRRGMQLAAEMSDGGQLTSNAVAVRWHVSSAIIVAVFAVAAIVLAIVLPA